jgi:hypothetical protein
MLRSTAWAWLAVGALLATQDGKTAAADPKDAPQEIIPGAKHLCTIQVCYGVETTLFASSDGLRILDRVHEKDPAEIIRNLPVGEFVPGKPPPGVKEVMANKSKLKMWNAVTGKELELPNADLRLDEFRYFCVSPDGTKKFQIENLDPIRNMGGFPQPGPGVTKPFRYKVTLLDLKTKQALFTSQLNNWNQPAARFASDSSFVVLITDSEFTVLKPGEKTNPKVKFTRKVMKTPYGSRPSPGEVAATFSPDGTHLGLGLDGTLRIFDVAKGTLVFETPANPKAQPNQFFLEALAFAFSPSLKEEQVLLAHPSGDFRLYDVKEKKEIGHSQLELPKPAVGGFGAGGLTMVNTQPYFNARNEPRAFYVDSAYVAQAKSFTYTGKFVDASKGTVFQQFESKGFHRYLLSPDGKYLVRTSFDKERYEGKRTVDVWSLEKVESK